jgi:hypothetical protein
MKVAWIGLVLLFVWIDGAAAQTLHITADRPLDAAQQERWQSEVSRGIEHVRRMIPEPHPDTIRVELYYDTDAYHAALGGSLHWSAAAAIPGQSRLLVDLSHSGNPGSRPGPTIRHELVHLFLGAHEQQNRHPIPRWFDEGLAQVVAGRSLYRQQEPALVDIPLADITEEWPRESLRARSAYVISLDAVNALLRAHGSDAPARILRAMGRDQSFAAAFEAVTDTTLRSFTRRVQPPSGTPAVISRVVRSVMALGFWGCLAIGVVILYVWARIRGRRILRQMEREEQCELGTHLHRVPDDPE